MIRYINGLAALLVVTVGALPARACINDREVGRAEREFKSQYLEQSPAKDSYAEPASTPGPIASVIFLSAGAAMLVGASFTVLTLSNRPRPV